MLLENKVVFPQRDDFLAWFEQSWFFGGLEKSLNNRLEIRGAAAGSPPHGGFRHYLYSTSPNLTGAG